MTSGVNAPEGPRVGDSSQTEDSLESRGSRQEPENPQTGDIPQTQESGGPSEGERRRGRSGSVVAWFIVAGTLLVLGFSPVSRLAAHGLPRAPGSSVAVATGPQRGNTTAIQAVPVGLPIDAHIRTAADVFPYAVAALGEQDALALMALVDSKSFLASTLVRGNTQNPYGSYSAWDYGGAVAGGSHGPVVKSWRSASSLLMPHLAAVDR